MLALLLLLSVSCVYVQCVAASKEDFPLVYVCLGITLAGIILAFYVAYRRPDTVDTPSFGGDNGQEPVGSLHPQDDVSLPSKPHELEEGFLDMQQDTSVVLEPEMQEEEA